MKNLLKAFVFIALAILTVAVSYTFGADAGASMALVGAMVPRDRALFKHLQTRYPGSTPSPSYLRIEQTLTNSKGVYEFRFMQTDNEVVTEQKLDRNDIFVVTDLAVYLLMEDTTKIGIGVLQTYVNQTVFPAVIGFVPTHLETVYNGHLQLKVGSKINIENLSMQEFRVVPSTQQSAATNLPELSAAAAKYKPDALIHLRGNANNTVTIEFPTFVGMNIAAVTANTNHKLVFHPYGYLLRNAAR